MKIEADTTTPPGGEWTRRVMDGSRLDAVGGAWRFTNDARRSGYSDSQIDDYQGLARRQFRWQPPLTLTVRARFSHPACGLRGTAGFGFWNDPFLMTGWRPPALPRAIWFFFASEPSDMKLDMAMPGHGWKAATIDALRLPAVAMLPAAPLAVPLMNVRAVYRALWPLAQRALRVSEALIDVDMTAWHTYALEWGTRRARFAVDGQTALDCDTPPRGPLGFVMWIDNQAMIATPWGRFHWQVLPLDTEQWMEVSTLRIEAGEEG